MFDQFRKIRNIDDQEAELGSGRFVVHEGLELEPMARHKLTGKQRHARFGGACSEIQREAQEHLSSFKQMSE